MNTSLQLTLQVERIEAIGLTVTNVDRSVDFYTKALGFELVSDTTVEQTDSSEKISDANIRIVTLKLGDEQIRLMQYLQSEGKPIPPDSQSNDLWFQHLAIVVRDMDCAYAYLQSFSIEPISTSPQTIPPGNKEAAYIQSFKFKDPDRHPLELIWFPPGKGQEKWHQNSDRLFLGIDHTAIAIADTEQSLQFYRDCLGMEIDGGSFNWRETQARMDGLPNAMVKITALRPSQGGLGIELLDYIQPTDGRSIPSDLNRCDIAYAQIELIVNHINLTVNQFQQRNRQAVSSSAVQRGDRTSAQEHLIKDPTGHALLLCPESMP